MGERSDLRVLKTREAIWKAFERLVENGDYSSVTVSAIAREARISRKTFYAHYESTDALLRAIVRNALDSVVQQLEPTAELQGLDDWAFEFSSRLLATLREHKYFSRSVVNCLSTAALLDIAREPLLEICTREAQRHGVGEVEGMRYYIAYFLGGLFSVYEAWQLSGDAAEELDKAALDIGRVASYGFATLLNEPAAG